MGLVRKNRTLKDGQCCGICKFFPESGGVYRDCYAKSQAMTAGSGTLCKWYRVRKKSKVKA